MLMNVISWWLTYSMFTAYSVEAQAPWVHCYALILLVIVVEVK